MKLNTETLIDALRQTYRGQIAVHRANIDVYLSNPAGIGEHPGIVEAIDEEVAKLAEADEKLETLNKYYP
jgi:hypothetical protein